MATGANRLPAMQREKAEVETNLLSLPSELLYNILNRLSYEDVTNVRRVCKTFDVTCQQILNQGFVRADRYHAEIQKKLKAELPRRESERRLHPLARHIDILSSIETRLSLLNMTYSKFIEAGMCCFIPGKVMDELFRVLHYIKDAKCPPRAHELLQELRDISSMAMEHFEENIAPIFKRQMPPNPIHNLSLSATPGPSSALAVIRPPYIRQELVQMKHSIRNNSTSTSALRKEVHEMRVKVTDQHKKNLDTDRKLTVQNRLINDQQKVLDQQAAQITDLNRKLFETDQKYTELLTEVMRIRGDGVSTSSRIGATPVTLSSDDSDGKRIPVSIAEHGDTASSSSNTISQTSQMPSIRKRVKAAGRVTRSSKKTKYN